MTTLVDQIGALSVGRVESVTAAELRISVFPETPQATAFNTGVPTGFPRINAYVLIPNETGAVVAVVKEIAIVQAKPSATGKHDAGLVDLPFPSTPKPRRCLRRWKSVSRRWLKRAPPEKR